MANGTEPTLLNPFPGLRPFHEHEEHLFFGRESQVDAMIDKLARTRFLSIVGTSGSGKSSLVNSGLRPALRRGLMAAAGTGWRIVQCRPGGSPVRTLSRAIAAVTGSRPGLESESTALADIVEATLRMSTLGLVDICEQCRFGDGVNVLIVIDQFEELFRYERTAPQAFPGQAAGSQEAAQLVSLLLHAAAQVAVPIYVSITMRSDFLGDCAQFTGLPEAINEGQYLVPRLSRDERTSAITGPAGVGGGVISPVLLTRLLNDVGDNPDQLSILQHALNRTWARWADAGGREGPVTLAHYDATGTMAHALDRHADEAYDELAGEPQRYVCEKMFRALTDVGSEARGIRRPMTVAALCALAEADQSEVTGVVDVFRRTDRAFLMPPLPEILEPDTVIDISHESLMRVWGRLKRWADEEAGCVHRLRRLSQTATEFNAGKAGLLRDPELQVSADWKTAARPNAGWAALHGCDLEIADRFLVASLEARDEGRRLEEQERRRELTQAQALSAEQTRSARRLRGGLIAAAVLLVLAVGAAALALKQRAEARRVGDVSLARQLAAQALLLGTEERTDLETAALLAVEAISRSPTLESDCAVRDAAERLARRGQSLTYPAPVRAVLFSPDGHWLATGGDDKVVHVLEAAGGKELWRRELPAAVGVVAFTPDGRMLAAAAADGSFGLFEADTGKELWLRAQPTPVTAIAFAPDAASVATAQGTVLRVLSTATGTEIWQKENRTSLTTIAVSADARWIVMAGGTTVRVLDAMTHEDVWTANQQHGIYGFGALSGVAAMALSGDSRLIAVGRGFEFGGGIWQIVEVATGSLVRFAGLKKGVAAVAFSPSGRELAVAETGGVMHAIDAGTGLEAFSVRTGTDVSSITYSPDGQLIATGGRDGTVRLVDARAFAEALRFRHQAAVTAVSFTPDGRQVASAGFDGHVRIVDAGADLAVLRVASGEGTHAQFSSDGRRLITMSMTFTMDLTISVMDLSTGKVVPGSSGQDVPVPPDAAPNRASADGVRSLTIDKNEVRVMDVKSTRIVSHFPLQGSAEDVQLSRDGNRVAMASGNHALVYDVTSGRETSRVTQSGVVEAVCFIDDGRRLLVASETASGDQIVVTRHRLVAEEMIEDACGRLTRNLTRDEWTQYFGFAAPYRRMCPNVP